MHKVGFIVLGPGGVLLNLILGQQVWGADEPRVNGHVHCSVRFLASHVYTPIKKLVCRNKKMFKIIIKLI